MLQEEDEESDVRDSKIITNQYALIGKDDFEFKKIRHKRVIDLELAPNLTF